MSARGTGRIGRFLDATTLEIINRTHDLLMTDIATPVGF